MLAVKIVKRFELSPGVRRTAAPDSDVFLILLRRIRHKTEDTGTTAEDRNIHRNQPKAALRHQTFSIGYPESET